MMQRGRRSLVIQMVKVVVLSLGVIVFLSGCSSRLSTTIVSGSDSPQVQMAQLEPEAVIVDEVVSASDQEVIRMDIPVEEPARAVSRPAPAEIFATSKSTDHASGHSSFSDGTFISGSESGESGLSSEGSASHSTASQAGGSGFLPTTAQPEGAATSPGDDPVVAQEPIQIAKVMPQEPEQVEIISEVLESALSDIYFDYDQFMIRAESEELLKANARLFSAKFANTQIVIEGHCDDRGTQSYNMILGERRAKAVKHYLQDLGVPAENLQVVSYGKDKPFCKDQTEACWQENRRGHFVIK